MAHASLPLSIKALRTASMAALLLSATNCFGLPFDLLYSATGGNSITGIYQNQNTGRVVAPYLQLSPLELSGGISGLTYNIDYATDASGYVSPGLITALTTARVFNAKGDVNGLADAGFQGLWEDTLKPNYTGTATFTMVLDSFLGATANSSRLGNQINSEFSARTGTHSFDVSIARYVGDSTSNSYTWTYTLPVVAGQSISVFGDLLLEVDAYGDPQSGDGYAFADASHTSEFFVQDVGGTGTFTSASGHDYTPLPVSAVPEPATLATSLTGILGTLLVCQRRFSKSSQEANPSV